MVSYCQDRNISSAKATVTAVRALLRYLHATGQIRVSLAGAAPAVARWRLASLPRGLDTAVVTALLDTPPRRVIDLHGGCGEAVEALSGFEGLGW